MQRIESRTPRSRWSIHAAVTALVVTGLAVGPASAGSGGYQPHFEAVSCETEQFAGRLPAGIDAECGLLTVPEDRTAPMAEDNRVVLPVVIVHASTADPPDDPVLLLTGGPGQSGIDAFTQSGAGLLGWAQQLAEQRDLIVLDTRGTGRAQPSLLCQNDALGMSWSATASYLNLSTTDDLVTEQARVEQALIDCAATLRAAGVDLDDYNRPAVAQDLADLRRALGVAKWNVYGVSAGTTLALELLRRQPGGQRSVVLDSVYPPFTETDPASVLAMRKAGFRAWIDAAGLDRDAVESSLAAIKARYDTAPSSATDPYTGIPMQYTGDDAVWALHLGMLVPDLLPLLELFVANLQYYDGTPATAALSLEPYFGPGIETVLDLNLAFLYPLFTGLASSDGYWIGVECADRAPLLEPADLAAVIAAEPIYAGLLSGQPTMPNVCDQIGVEPAPAQSYRIHQVGVPSLVLAGSLDVLRTPPAVSAQVSDMLGTWSQFVEFPRAGHAVAGYSQTDPASQCADAMIASFIDSPRAPVDTGCVGG